MRCVLISHQLDYSGAPLALLDLATALKVLGGDIMLWSLKLGPLANEFTKIGIPINRQVEGEVELIVANTVFAAQATPSLGLKAKRKVAWIHESPTFFRYHPRLSYDYIPASYFDLIAGVAGFQVEALRAKFPSSRIIRFDNVYRLPEIGLPDSERLQKQSRFKVALIAGFEPRKGVLMLRQLYECQASQPSELEVHCFGLEPNQLSTILPIPLEGPIHVIAHGRLARSELLHQISKFDALLSLSEDEVKPLTILEALAIGLSSYVTDIPAHRELASEFPSIEVSKSPIQGIVKASTSAKSCKPMKESSAFVDALGRYSWSSFIGRAELLLSLVH